MRKLGLALVGAAALATAGCTMGLRGGSGSGTGTDGSPALRNPGRFRSVSAFSPISAPSQVAWGHKAFSGYLGEDEGLWRTHDAVALIEDGARLPELLVDVGDADPFIENQLRPELLEQACAEARIALTLRRQPGYDHSYYFISTFMADHLRWHSERLRGA